MTAYVRNHRGVIHPVPAADVQDHLARHGMSLATLEDWQAQEGIAPTPEPVVEKPAKTPARKSKEV